MSLSLQGYHHLPAGHVLQSAIGLYPVPPLAENSGDGAAAAVPMIIDNSLNEWQIGVANGPFSDGDGQHDHRISKRILGRQQKMQVMKIFFQENFWQEIRQARLAANASRWVETKNRGLEMTLKSS